MDAELPPPPPLAEIGEAALFLDLDGTLAAIEPRPEDVKPEPWRTRLLQRLIARLGGRVAIVSGRSLPEVDRILEGAVPAVAAVHGLVRRCPDGQVIRAPTPEGMAAAIAAIADLVAAHPALRLEDKGLSLAVHYRQAPQLEALVRGRAAAIAGDQGLRLQLGEMVAEIRAPGFDKGVAVRAFMEEAPFGGGQPTFVGDDLTDEDGFEAVRALGGLGVLVGPRRATQASRRLAGANAVRAWLEAAVMEGARP